MQLAKPHLDVGLFTNQPDAMLEFWQREVGLPFEELLAVGGGARQHRHGMNGSVLKINAVRDPLPAGAPSGYRELIIARAGIAAPRPLLDPDGNRVTLVPPGHARITGIGVRMVVRDADAAGDFFGRVMQFEPAGAHAYRCGDSLLSLVEDPSVERAGAMRALGLRYLTVQVFDDELEHRGLLARGAEEGRAPIVMGTTARFSFVRDPDGNWIEISQRASLTGAL